MKMSSLMRPRCGLCRLHKMMHNFSNKQDVRLEYLGQNKTKGETTWDSHIFLYHLRILMEFI